MRFRTFLGSLVAVVSCVLIAPVSSQAVTYTSTGCAIPTQCTLQELFVIGSSIILDEGDGITKTFNSFSLGNNTGTNPLTLSAIDVLLATSGDEVGLRFVINGGAFLTSNQTVDLGFHFDVLCTGCLLHDNTLQFTGGATGTGNASISEGVVDVASEDTVATKLVFVTSQISDLVDHKIFAFDSPLVQVNKDLNMQGGTDGTVQVSDFIQTFSQTRIPEPGSLLLIGAGLVVIGLIGRKRRNR